MAVMRERHRLPLVLLCGLALAALSTALIAGAASGRDAARRPRPQRAAAAARPNIVFILTDDQDLLLGSLDAMPHLRWLLGTQGLTFSHDFVPLSLCCPSRSTILTGQYAHNHKVYTNAPPDGGFQEFLRLGHEEATIGTALHEAGYRTALMGKYLNEYPHGSDRTHVPPGWDEWDVPIDGNAYGGFNYTLNQNGKLIPHGAAPADYMTDVITARARQFIAGAAAGPSPFFLYVATYAPHRPYTPAPRHAALFANAKAPRTPSFNEADVSDKPEGVRARPPLTAGDIAFIDRGYRLRLQGLQAVDEMVAAIVRTLRNNGQLDNTYIFFTSDNGYHMGQHRMLPAKYTPYETDVRVPLLVRGPGVPAGRTVDAFTLNVDFAPTFAEIAGATLREPVDGRSLVPLLHGGPVPADWRKSVLLEQFTFREAPQPAGTVREPSEAPAAQGVVEYPSHLGLRTPTYKYVEYANGERELYDLTADPDETENQARRADPGFLAQLSDRVHRLNACAAAACRQLEALPPPVRPAGH